jgi:hypothetical protein
LLDDRGAVPGQLKALDEFIAEARLKNDLAEWRRGCALSGRTSRGDE